MVVGVAAAPGSSRGRIGSRHPDGRAVGRATLEHKRALGYRDTCKGLYMST